MLPEMMMATINQSYLHQPQVSMQNVPLKIRDTIELMGGMKRIWVFLTLRMNDTDDYTRNM